MPGSPKRLELVYTIGPVIKVCITGFVTAQSEKVVEVDT